MGSLPCAYPRWRPVGQQIWLVVGEGRGNVFVLFAFEMLFSALACRAQTQAVRVGENTKLKLPKNT